ncbi:SprT family protein [Vagococcus vulneris]|uniref:SprT family protein n=1 Tax=Vagococcus vulneris TaxID=1977869 RepID=A0A429ZY24_9ENTE|nr:SprT family protein [Vagococcus vulneris]RST98803.1 SprT family protein [Vagococcus vulneris]
MSGEELQTLVETLSMDYFGLPFTHQAVFNSRLRTTGGRYHLTDHHLDFNPKVYELYGLSELTGVIKHELCHYHLHLAGKGYQHRDADFRMLLKETNSPRFVKNLTTNKSQKKYRYQCQKCEQLIVRQRRINLMRFGCCCGGQLVEL